MVDVENLYAEVSGKLSGSDPMQFLKKLVNSELECIRSKLRQIAGRAQ